MKKYEKILLGMALILLLTDFLWCLITNLAPTIQLKDGDITLDLNESYIEPGYHAFHIHHDISNQVIVKHNIDSTKTGTYTVTYSLSFQGKTYQKQRSVTVVDRIAPKITLKGPEKVTVCPNQEYQEEGYQSIDNYDGDLTHEVVLSPHQDFILYSVKDHSGNTATIKRWITYEDKNPPTITLKGGNAYSLYVGDTYQEPGYEAHDHCDGDLTDQVVVKSNVNTNKIGTYEIIYEVTDQASNKTKVSRKVVVLGPKPNNGKVIYLTFDDGPSTSITPALLDILKEENVKATFFVLNHGEALDYLIKREYEEGHTVAIHGNSHNYKQIYRSATAYFEDLAIIQNKVKKITGETPMIIRFPGGSSNTVSRFNPGIMTFLTKEVKRRGFHYFDWNVGSGDAGEAHTPEEVYRNVTQSLGNKNNIVLMHDYANNYKTLNAIRNIIRYGKRNGYTFSRITMETPEVHHRIAN